MEAIQELDLTKVNKSNRESLTSETLRKLREYTDEYNLLYTKALQNDLPLPEYNNDHIFEEYRRKLHYSSGSNMKCVLK
ncbi:hypothetical protein [uncultured Roseivirga sp.]|uniref:hypothetical protein n=1 Tax=uncultured Roseivirga sp. TaxID=543088 RepID=UPI0030DB60D1|tara:strand:- start:55939 stop:56175 length:237 start_codon:yes stop_codon:yes gene_type:complete